MSWARGFRGALAAGLFAFGAVCSAQDKLPTAAELIAVIEISAERCVTLGEGKANDFEAVRTTFGRWLKKRSYNDYLVTDAYRVARAKGDADVVANGFDKRLCGHVMRMAKSQPENVMFFEPN
jgi:hypothetical protein